MTQVIAIPFITVAGVVAFGSVSDASVSTIDNDGDGYAEGWLIDRWEDGTADIEADDSDLDGTPDL